MIWGLFKRWLGRADKAGPVGGMGSGNVTSPGTRPDAIPVEIQYEWCGGNCPVQAEGHLNGYYFYFRGRGEGWHIEVGIPKGHVGWYGVAAWEYEETYHGPSKDAGWMGEDEAKAFIEQAARRWAADEGWKASDALAAEIAAEYRARGELD